MRRLLLVFMAAIGFLAAGEALAQTAAPAQPGEPSPEKVRALSDLLRDPAIQAWLQVQAAGAAKGGEPAPAAGEPATSAQQTMANRLDAMRGFIRNLAAAVPTLPEELHNAWATFAAEFYGPGSLRPGVFLAIFAALGFGFEGLFRWLTAGFRRRLIAARLDTVNDRLRAVWMRLVYGAGLLLAFAVGSVGAFLVFDWPPLFRQVVLAYLSVFLIVRFTLVLGRILLAPGAERFRVLPMSSPAARFWFVWSAVLAGYYFFVKFTLDLLGALGVHRPAGYLVGLACGVILLGLAQYVLWRAPPWDGSQGERGRPRLGTWLTSLYLVVVWLLLFTGSPTPFFIGIILLLLPIAMRINHRAVNHLLRPAGSQAGGEAAPSFITVSLERGLRAALLIGGAFAIAGILDLDLGALTASDTPGTRFLRGGLNALVILLLADFAWSLAKAVIDRKLALGQGEAQADSPDERRRARMQTLLPVLRNFLFVLLLAMAFLMALSAMGIEIGPLIAGAGVVGVAIGFGAQTLVKDIISGVFYLFDDAFRVGEYIQTGSYKGTVESFSLRSVKLRHHRGPLYTVPFGVLGAVQNMSRDWVIDKMTIGVTYDTDIEKVKKIVKKVGEALQNDPEFAPHFIEPLKMQGVEQFGDYAIQLRIKMKTKPNEQFTIRRRAYAMIKKAFDEQGIKFAYPTVQVAGGDPAVAAAAQQALELSKPPAPA